MINAILPMWKPIEWTSFDVVKKIRNQVKPSKVGHAGSLDPFAEGVLMLCIGASTKKVESLMDKEKEYIAEIKLGIETDTLDKTGKIINIADVKSMSSMQITQVLNNFIGKIGQTPPMYSALKINGQPLYKFARHGINIYRKKRFVTIYKIELIHFNNDKIVVKVLCGRGTYIRSLAKDIARELNTVGHLVSLVRTRIGEYDRRSCVFMEDFSKWISAKA